MVFLPYIWLSIIWGTLVDIEQTRSMSYTFNESTQSILHKGSIEATRCIVISLVKKGNIDEWTLQAEKKNLKLNSFIQYVSIDDTNFTKFERLK